MRQSTWGEIVRAIAMGSVLSKLSLRKDFSEDFSGCPKK